MCSFYLFTWCGGYHYYSISFNKILTQFLWQLKSCLQHVGDSQWWGPLTMVPAGNKAKCFLLVNHTIENNSSSSVSTKTLEATLFIQHFYPAPSGLFSANICFIEIFFLTYTKIKSDFFYLFHWNISSVHHHLKDLLQLVCLISKL